MYVCRRLKDVGECETCICACTMHGWLMGCRVVYIPERNWVEAGFLMSSVV